MTPAPDYPPIDPPRRVLVSRLRQIGDAILSTPLLDALRERFPDVEVDYLAESGPAQAIVGHPAVRTVHALAPRSGWPLPGPPGLLLALRRANYDWAIDLYGNPRSALMAAITGASVRVGPDRRGRRHLYTHLVPPVREPISAVDHHLLALRALGISARSGTPRIHLSVEEREAGRALLDERLPRVGPRIGLHVGNRWAAKRWPEEKFAALLRVLSNEGVGIAVLAGPGEEPLAERVRRAHGGAAAGGAVVLAGLPLRRYWALLAALDALVTNDGSPLHAGPAVGTPTVGILGPTVPAIWFPYAERDGHQLLCKEIWCRPCHRHECRRLDCLDWIGVAEVRAAVGRALAHGAERRGVA